jgi:hypothetical protein
VDAIYVKVAAVPALCEEALLEDDRVQKCRKQWVHKMWQEEEECRRILYIIL